MADSFAGFLEAWGRANPPADLRRPGEDFAAAVGKAHRLCGAPERFQHVFHPHGHALDREHAAAFLEHQL